MQKNNAAVSAEDAACLAPGPLLTVRAAVILLLALLAGAAAAVLAYLAYHSVPGAVLTGGSATGGAILLFHTVIGR